MIWGGISASTAAVKNYNQLLAVRICLGVVEVSRGIVFCI
jgi:hypothetical protein